MTAINPARLKLQIAELGELIDQADQFAAGLHELLAYYSARIQQTSLSKTPLRLQTYQVPKPVIRALENEISERLVSNPEAGFPIVDALWDEYWIEFRQIAVQVLGILPPNEPDRILDRILIWLDDCSSEDIRLMIMTEGLNSLASESPDQCIALIEKLVSRNDKGNHQAALFGLGMFARSPSYLNLPILYRNLARILQTVENGLIKEICALVRILIDRSEQETTYFLIKQLDLAYQPRFNRVVRQVINNLSQDNQILLREKMEALKKRT